MSSNKSSKSSKISSSCQYSSAFNSAVRRGTPASVAVANIAKRTGRTITQIWTSLHRADQVQRQKISGQWVYWAASAGKASTSVTHTAHACTWQAIVDWVIASGWVTPQQIASHSGSRQKFTTFLRRWFNRQFTSTTSSTGKSSTSRTTRSGSSAGSRTRSTARSRTQRTTARSTRRTTAGRRTTTRSLRLTTGRSSTTRRRRAA